MRYPNVIWERVIGRLRRQNGFPFSPGQSFFAETVKPISLIPGLQ